jgi:membrane protease YdiL (CAAX protease family)
MSIGPPEPSPLSGQDGFTRSADAGPPATSTSLTATPPGPPSEAIPPAPRFRRTGIVLAWVVILGLIGFIVGRTFWIQVSGGPALERADLVTMRLQARYMIGLSQLPLIPMSGPFVLEQAEENLNRGPYAQRLRFVVLAGELGGPEEALQRLDALQELRQQGLTATREQEQLARDLRALYEEYQKGEDHRDPARALTPEQSEQLRTRLGWFGQLALHPSGGPEPEARQELLWGAMRTAVGALAYISLLLLLAFVGLFLLVLVGALWFVGQLRGGLVLGSGHGGVYAEMFALYMLLFFGLSFAARWVPAGQFRLLLAGGITLATLAVLAWPVLRGVPWARVRRDLGLYAGRKPVLEPFLGPATYVACLPLVILGILTMLGLTMLRNRLGWGPGPFEPSGNPSHPIITGAGGGWVVYLQMFLVAAVIAPIVEETMFRGALYQHLREATGRAGKVVSVLLSALCSSFLFAVIHPQGILAVPVLMALAVGFCLAREWRGTLLPSMIAHGINNGLAVLLLIVLAG